MLDQSMTVVPRGSELDPALVIGENLRYLETSDANKAAIFRARLRIDYFPSLASLLRGAQPLRVWDLLQQINSAIDGGSGPLLPARMRELERVVGTLRHLIDPALGPDSRVSAPFSATSKPTARWRPSLRPASPAPPRRAARPEIQL